jgi:hypothetical protein
MSATLLFLGWKKLLPTTGKKTDTESLSNPNNGYTFKVNFSTHQFILHIHVQDELTANVLFAVAESYPLFGKVQRWRCRSYI